MNVNKNKQKASTLRFLAEPSNRIHKTDFEAKLHHPHCEDTDTLKINK